MRGLPLAFALTCAAAAQEVPPLTPEPVTPESATRESQALPKDPALAKAMLRMRSDLGVALRQIENVEHAYQGTLTVRSNSEDHELALLEHDFRGAHDGTIDWFAMDGWQVASRNNRVAVQTDEQPWTEPQGDTPDVPLSPKVFLPHLSRATLSPPTPAEHNGRPAMRVHASWHGKSRKHLLYQTTVPSTQHEMLLEALASAAGKDRKNFVVDATLLYDPATQRWLATTLRFAYMDGREIPDEEQPPPAPVGLPPLISYPVIEAIWHIEHRKFQDAKRPLFDARAKQLLELDTQSAQRKENRKAAGSTGK